MSFRINSAKSRIVNQVLLAVDSGSAGVGTKRALIPQGGHSLASSQVCSFSQRPTDFSIHTGLMCEPKNWTDETVCTRRQLVTVEQMLVLHSLAILS